jgi:hypothetical protein
METHQEFYKALFEANEAVINLKYQQVIKVIDGNLHLKYIGSPDTDYKRVTHSMLIEPNLYEIHKEPQWFEKDISKGVACKVKNEVGSEWSVDVIYIYAPDAESKFIGACLDWNIAEPLDLTQPLLPQLKV